MMRCVALLLWVIMVVFASAESSSPVFTMPAKPKGQVSDESKWLSPEEQFEWERQLESWKHNDGVDIYLVILPNLHNTPADHVMQEIAKRWGAATLRGVVLYVPSSAGPRIWWEGEIIEKINLDPRAQREMILRMEKKAGSESTERERVSSAMYQLSDTMRVIHSQWKQFSAMRDKWNDTIYQKWAKDRMIRRAKWIGIAAVVLTALAVVALLLHRRLSKQRRYFFPQVSAQRRFGALHAGGSGAVVSLQSSRTRP